MLKYAAGCSGQKNYHSNLQSVQDAFAVWQSYFFLIRKKIDEAKYEASDEIQNLAWMSF